MERKPLVRSPFLVDAISGLVGGTALVYSSQPFDTVKTKLQTFPKYYNNSLTKCFRDTLKNEGIYKGLYRGTIPAIGVNGLENMVLFVAYEQIQKKVQPTETWQLALCGSASSFFSTFVVCPTELLKCRMQASYELGTKRESIPALTKKLFFEKRIPGTGLYTGIVSTWCREIPGYFFFFYGKEVFRDKLKSYPDSFNALVSGTLAGLCYWTAMLPVDNIKTNLQVKNDGRGFVELMRETIRTKPASLYNGYSATVLRAIPANMALFYVYEKVKAKLEGRE